MQPRRALLFLLPLTACSSSSSAPESSGPGVFTEKPTPVASAADARRAFEIADLYRVANPSAPALSPDGSRIAFSVRRTDLEAGKSWSEIWIVGRDGSDARALTAGGNNDTGPVFTPDGKQLVFSSTRDKSDQLWVLPLAGGDARQLTHFAPGLFDPVLSPDGKWIAATAELWPECGIDVECHERIRKGLDDGKTKVRTADELLYRHWTSWNQGRRACVVLVDASSGEVVRTLSPLAQDAPTFQLGGGRGYDFSPDSSEVCFVQNRAADQAGSTNADLWAVPIRGGEARCLTVANTGWDGAPLYSPDGRSIAYISQATPGYESDLRTLAVLDRASGKVTHLTDRESFGDGVDDFRWSADSKRIVFEASREGRTPLYEVPALGGTPRELLRHGTLGGFELARDGGIVFGARRIEQPPELFALDAHGSAPRALTQLNRPVTETVDVRPATEFRVAGEGDYEIHGFLVTPHGFDPTRKYPLILNVHGGPQSQWTDGFRGDWQVYPGKGYVVAFCNPTGSTGYGQDFCDAIGGDYGGRVYRDLMRVTDALATLPYVDANHMGLMGWSFGGYMSMWVEGQTDRFAANAAMMGIFDLRAFHGATEELWFPEHDMRGTPWTSEEYERWSPCNYVKNFETPALVITGELDYRCPYTQSLAYYTALQRMDVPSRLVVFPEAGHWPAWHEMAVYYNEHLAFFREYLGGGEAPWDVTAHARNLAFGGKQ
jgi:dipeptidyl aminopeptidase/acylaminoacyl peptidase